MSITVNENSPQLTISYDNQPLSINETTQNITINQQVLSLIINESHNTLLVGNDDEAVGDHGALSGLTDDDHPHYLTDARLAAKTENELLGIPLAASFNYENGRLTQVTKGNITKIFTYDENGNLIEINDGTYIKTLNYTNNNLSNITITTNP